MDDYDEQYFLKLIKERPDPTKEPQSGSVSLADLVDCAWEGSQLR